MGLEKDSGKGHGMMHPPIFEPDKDILVWRKDVASWVHLISTAAVPPLRKDKARSTRLFFAILAREDGTMDYRKDDQVKDVQERVILIVADQNIAVVTRLIASVQKLMNCKRKQAKHRPEPFCVSI